jgi:hypothetical protein
MSKKESKIKSQPIKSLDKESIEDKDDPERVARDWHGMTEEEQMEVLSHLSDMPFQ